MAAVTGEPISVVRNAIRLASGKVFKTNGSAWPVIGMYNDELIRAMQQLDWYVIEQWSEAADSAPYTLDAFAVEHGDDGPFIVNVTGHYVAISQGEFCDTAAVLPKNLFGGVLDRPWFGRTKRKGATWVRNWWRFENRPTDWPDV
jgi:hypothetical protein